LWDEKLIVTATDFFLGKSVKKTKPRARHFPFRVESVGEVGPKGKKELPRKEKTSGEKKGTRRRG